MINLEKIKAQKSIQELLEFSILNIDKPAGMTSFDVCERVKYILKIKKTGHFGTLDPQVTGVLPIALNKACRLTGYFIKHDKEYIGIMRFHKEVKKEDIEKIIYEKFLGKIKQRPPVRSRVKRVEREREVKKFEILQQEKKDFQFHCEVEGGTYIRKLIDDIGKALGINAHMLQLRRTRAGIFSEKQKTFVTLEKLEQAFESYKNGEEILLRDIIIPGEIISEIYPVTQLKKEYLQTILNGKKLEENMFIDIPKMKENDKIIIFCGNNLIAIVKRINESKRNFVYEFVMHPSKKLL